jgi:glutathione synthase/RimK-type ligase-like ATP-grasp enzyme
MGDRGWTIEIGGRYINVSAVRSGYLRRPESPAPDLTVLSVAHHNYCAKEWSAALVYLLRSLGKRWLNSPLAILEAENKPKQLARAFELGFQIPETIITNKASTVRRFVSDGPSVAKPLTTALMEIDGREQVIFTSQIEALHLEDDVSIEAAPIILQKQIIKQCDLRVTVVGSKIFAAEIHSQDREETIVDWRKGSRPDLPHKKHELPYSIAERCISLTKSFGLRFSAIDLVLDKLGNYWFLEINPNGQWAWIENRLGLPIAEAIADELEGIYNDTNNL